MPARIAALALASLIAFAANSVLARLALRSGSIDAASYTSIRLATGAFALALLVLAGGQRPTERGTWRGAFWLALYALPFSFAYLALSTGAGALILFGAVQLTMIGTGIARGERPTGREWVGLGVAVVGLLALVSPGVTAPPAWAALLMAVAGFAWGVYSLRGRGVADPLRETAGNFVRSVAFAVPALLLARSGIHAGREGVLLAAASGALASGCGYAIWYAALPALTATRAAVAQLAVPAIAAVAGIALLGEPLTLRLLLSGCAILGGVALAVTSGPR
ncbi:MAG: DMT family transporter [Gemmatimonadales bacterium]